MEIKEGYMPFMGYQTYYRIVGKTEEGKSPIILLHGGPGSTHNYFELLDRVAESGRTVIMYDQLGCGNSFVEGHPELWTPETWLNELCVLIDYLHIDHFHLLGQSWGGMLAIIYLIEKQAKGVKSAILSSTLSSSRLRRRMTFRARRMPRRMNTSCSCIVPVRCRRIVQSVFAGRSVLVLRLISMVGDQMNTLLLVRSVIMITPTVWAKSKCLAW